MQEVRSHGNGEKKDDARERKFKPEKRGENRETDTEIQIDR